MTGRIAAMSMDGTPISQADIARIEQEERLHAEQKRRATRAVAAAAHDAEDCKLLLEVLGLDADTVRAARDEQRDRPAPVARPAARRRSRAA